MINLECTGILQIVPVAPAVEREISTIESEVGCTGWRSIKSDACLNGYQPKVSENLTLYSTYRELHAGVEVHMDVSIWTYAINWRREWKEGEQVWVSAEQNTTEDWKVGNRRFHLCIRPFIPLVQLILLLISQLQDIWGLPLLVMWHHPFALEHLFFPEMTLC